MFVADPEIKGWGGGDGKGLAFMLERERVPFLLTLLLAVLGWSVTYMVDQLGSSPVIRYTKKTDPSQNTITYNIKNISRSTLFKKVRFYVVLKGEGKSLGDPLIRIYPPLYLGEERVQPEWKPGNYAEFQIAAFQPGCEMDMIVKTEKPADSTIHVTCDEAVLLIENSLRTLLLEHEMKILGGLIALWVLGIAAYLIRINSKTPSRKKHG